MNSHHDRDFSQDEYNEMKQEASSQSPQSTQQRKDIMKTLIAMMGLPRSGKSTWAGERGFPIVNLDAVRLAVHGQAFVAELEKMVWTVADYMTRALLPVHDTVVFDATNTTRKRRDALPKGDWEIRFKHIDTDFETCIERAREVDFPIDVVKRMHEQFEPLEEGELKWETR